MSSTVISPYLKELVISFNTAKPPDSKIDLSLASSFCNPSFPLINPADCFQQRLFKSCLLK
ncbi:hypothetical protein [Clostridium sp.]|uniref:hypothetical protein n=1 Tax=Clostridium sp. TaxID=1506 RepID=UPI00257A8F23|nr:hypothetical protein [Clostridium sp.]MDU7240678.1 hypothetical protein [Clostridium sp.]